MCCFRFSWFCNQFHDFLDVSRYSNICVPYNFPCIRLPLYHPAAVAFVPHFAVLVAGGGGKSVLKLIPKAITLKSPSRFDTQNPSRVCKCIGWRNFQPHYPLSLFHQPLHRSDSHSAAVGVACANVTAFVSLYNFMGAVYPM